jgi:hypothetical protein
LLEVEHGIGEAVSKDEAEGTAERIKREEKLAECILPHWAERPQNDVDQPRERKV